MTGLPWKWRTIRGQGKPAHLRGWLCARHPAGHFLCVLSLHFLSTLTLDLGPLSGQGDRALSDAKRPARLI